MPSSQVPSLHLPSKGPVHTLWDHDSDISLGDTVQPPYPVPLLLVKCIFLPSNSTGVRAGDALCRKRVFLPEWGILRAPRGAGRRGAWVGSSGPAAPFSAGAGLPLLRRCVRPVQVPAGVSPGPGSFSAQPILGLGQPLGPPGCPLRPPEQRLMPARPPDLGQHSALPKTTS